MPALAPLPLTAYKARILSPPDIADLMATQQAVLNALSAAKKTFILAKTTAQFHARMTSLGQMIGLYALSPQGGERMAAYGCIAYPQARWPKADMVIPLDRLPCPLGAFGVIQSDVVHPDHRRQGLHQTTIALREKLCLQAGRPHLLAEVAASNPASLKGFFAQGYHIFYADHAPDDGRRLLFLHKSIGGKLACPAKESSLAIDPVARFATLADLLKNGYRAWGMERTDNADGYKLRLIAPGPF